MIELLKQFQLRSNVMISNEIIKQIKHIEIQTNILVNNMFGGEYHSAFKGIGMEFDEVREYSPGDDIRNIECTDNIF